MSHITLPLESSPIGSQEAVSEKGKESISIIIKILLTFRTPRPHSENHCSDRRPSACSHGKMNVPKTGDGQHLRSLEEGWVSTGAAVVESLSRKQLKTPSLALVLACTIRWLSLSILAIYWVAKHQTSCKRNNALLKQENWVKSRIRCDEFPHFPCPNRQLESRQPRLLSILQHAHPKKKRLGNFSLRKLNNPRKKDL